ncbi:MAG TPA: hypothetical protein PLG57_04825 [Bacteroidia bacterium]|jgi:hypothetical protein|nr:hypothetical protein [Bacteroidia bacterium]HQF27646.1 hypothetical protein [Bacteroidia bacterium]HQK97381.1 hypothetical protein [Bacteroidia bacterium]
MNSSFELKKWIKSSFFGWILGVAFILMFSGALESIGIHHMQFYLGLAMGLGVGLIQWLYLRRFIPLNLTWALLSAIGLSLPLLLFDLVTSYELPHKLLFCISAGSVLSGLFQYLLLKPHYKGAIHWIITSFFSWTSATAIVFLIDYTWSLRTYHVSNLWLAIINLVLILSGGLVLGLLSGISLRKMIIIKLN